jgi:hypothetical protein
VKWDLSGLRAVNPRPFADEQRQLLVAAPSGQFLLSALLHVSCDNSLDTRRTVVWRERVGAGRFSPQATSAIAKTPSDGWSRPGGRDLDPSGVQCRHTVDHLLRPAHLAVLTSLA